MASRVASLPAATKSRARSTRTLYCAVVTRSAQGAGQSCWARRSQGMRIAGRRAGSRREQVLIWKTRRIVCKVWRSSPAFL